MTRTAALTPVFTRSDTDAGDGPDLGDGRVICWFNPGGMIDHDVVTSMAELAAAVALSDVTA